MKLSRILCASSLALLVVGVPGAGAQTQPGDTAEARKAVEARLGRTVTQQEMLEMLRQSGMTRQQLRDQLRQAGYDPSLGDVYYDMMEEGTEPGTAAARPDFVAALERLGLSGRLRDLTRTREIDAAGRSGTGRDSARARAPLDAGPPSRIFGRSLFRGSESQFSPVLTGPVSSDYLLGPGDELILVLTGDVELAYELEVSREGYIFIPDVGQVLVNGLTLPQLQERLYERLGRVYSGVSRAGGTTQFQVSVGELRVNQVFVIGEVVRPGAVEVNGMARVLNALYQAGGPSEQGSFRTIEVRRGNAVVQVVDLYDYLLRGDASSDIRLEHNDRIFVPPALVHVEVEGAVRRPAIYELKGSEGLRDLLTYAGGLRADADVRRIQIDRVQPPELRRPGVNRVLLDVDLDALRAGAPDERLHDGDRVIVFAVPEEQRHRLWVEGEVRAPGLYEWAPGMTLWDLLERASGLSEAAYTPRALVYRMDMRDRSRRLIQTPLLTDDGGSPARDLVLADLDSVVIFSREELRNAETVTIEGYVKQPSTYALAEGMTLQDLVLLAGGFSEGANVLEAEVARRPDPLLRSDTTAVVVRVPLASALPGASNPGAVTWSADAGSVVLQHGDHVFIRRAPGYEPVREVRITGEVRLPGAYVLEKREERIADLVRRAGGLTDEAHAKGIRLVRGDRIVAADLAKALRNPRDRNNVMLQPGDSVHVPEFDPMVTVQGAVNFETHVLYRSGRDLDWYIDQAGGYRRDADRKGVMVLYPNGERDVVNNMLIFRTTPGIEPGAVIQVPAVPEGTRNGTNWEQVISRGLATISVLLTILLAVDQLSN